MSLSPSDGTIECTAAGRTDSGVHALAQVAHIDFAKDLPKRTVKNGINYYLSKNNSKIIVLEAEVRQRFHPNKRMIRTHRSFSS